MFAHLSLFSTIRIALVAMCLDTRIAEPIEDDLANFTSDLHQLHHAVTDPNSDLQFIISNFFDHRMDFDRFTQRVFNDYCERILKDYDEFLSKSQLEKFVSVSNKRLQRGFRDYCITALENYLRTSQFKEFHLSKVDGENNTFLISVPISTNTKTEIQQLVIHLDLGKSDRRIIDVETGNGLLLSEMIRSEFQEILNNNYSLPVLESKMREQRYVVIEDFSTAEPGQLPEGWGWRDKDQDKPKLYSVIDAGQHRYLAAQDTGSSVILLKVAHWNPHKYPILTWCWRAESLPPNADERYGPTNDSAAGLYVIFSQNWLGIPRQIKYVWSSTLPEGTVDRRKRFARPWFFVVESGDKNVGQWTFEQVDLLADYRRVYSGKPQDRTRGLGILTDANSTNSYAEAYYADFRVWTREDLDSGDINNHCKCLQDPSPEQQTSSRINSMRGGI